ncbi:15-hydroxyprostaglandin dehydrogenase [NAD(+)]-like isoform X2 [Zophobas morio]|uniref:15-hydroxyprostaglandin dehydrogenase [NAD(+)]-like isoform X2 n=1 Tax=Zophobas morio TaxID=2755281 RepID=UPI003082A6C2
MDFVAGKVAFVTGGAGGIGLAIVKSLLQHGAKGIGIVDISDEAGRKAMEIVGENKVIFIKSDVTKKAELEGAFETTIQTYKQLDIVINNAGVVDEHGWKNAIALNLVLKGSKCLSRQTMTVIAGKVALVTGGAGGIGLAMVKNLVQHGAKGVAIVDISEEAGFRAINEIVKIFGENKATFIKADVTKKTELEAVFETTIKTYNQLDIVINNAGKVDEFDWKSTVELNLVAVIEGTYLAMKKYLPKYKSGDEGLIVNTASTCGFHTFQVAPIYCTTKHGLVGLGKALGGEEFYKKYQAHRCLNDQMVFYSQN